MSGAFARFGKFISSAPRNGAGRQLFSAAGYAGPRRIVLLATTSLAVLGLVVLVASSGHHAPPFSHDARMASVDPLPGGLHSTPEQQQLATTAETTQANAALHRGKSYTPPMAPSVKVLPAQLRVEQPDPIPAPGPQPVATVRPAPAPHRELVPRPLQVAFPLPLDPPAAAAPVPAPAPRVIAVADTMPEPTATQAYRQQINALFSQWGGRLPRTDVVLPPKASPGDQGGGGNAGDRNGDRNGSGQAYSGAAARHGAEGARGASVLPVSVREDNRGRVLVPAGRGVYAHPILAVSSDASAPVVLEADSGPIAGDRMIGSFARQKDRLVIHVNQVIHHGESIGVDGLVIAPGSMEVGVASDVDQHYVSRFLLPAAAAFVAGLGQAIAQTSNTATVLSPFGGASYATRLNINQQLGVAAGAAASQVGAALTAAAPKGPTVSLEPNVAVGVMFLSSVTAHDRQ